VATILLVLLAVTVLALRGTGVGIALGPLVSPTPAARATPPASTAGSPSPGNAQLFGQIETQVRALRGLAAPNLAAPDIVTRARLSLVEGDATTVMLRGAIDHMTPKDLLGVSQGHVPDKTGSPAWMVDELEVPYTAGAQFVARLVASGGWSAVDAAFRAPPASPEQILHYDKYVSRQAPVKVAAPPLPSSP